MSSNSLRLNSSKSKAIVIGAQTKKAGITHITNNGQPIPLSSLVTNLGVKLDSTLSFDAHIKSVCQTSFVPLRNITPVLHSLHWFPVNQRINFKLLLLVFKATNSTGPTSLQELLSPQPVTQVWQLKAFITGASFVESAPRIDEGPRLTHCF